MRKVLIAIPWFSPAFKAGGPIQSIANLIASFHENVAYFIYCGNKDLGGELLNSVPTDSWHKFSDNCKVWYSQTTATKNGFLKIEREVQPHSLFVIGLFSWPFNIVPVLFGKTTHKILSVRGMLHPGALGQKKVKKRVFLSLFKILCLHEKVSFHATDAAEETFVRSEFGDQVRVTLAANYPRYFSNADRFKSKGHLKLISIALVSPMKNHLLVLKALSAVSTNVAYEIYGPIMDQRYWSDCLAVITNLPENIKVEYKGVAEPNSIERLLHAADVFILPSQSENFGHSIFESLSAGRPVITSKFTPWNALQESKAGINVDLDVESVASAVSFFSSMGQTSFLIWSESAAGYANKALDTKRTNRQYAELFQMQSATFLS